MIDRLRRFPVTKLLFSLLLLVRSWLASGERVPARADGSRREWYRGWAKDETRYSGRSTSRKDCNFLLIICIHQPRCVSSSTDRWKRWCFHLMYRVNSLVERQLTVWISWILVYTLRENFFPRFVKRTARQRRWSLILGITEWTETILLHDYGLIHSYTPCRMNMHADRRNPVSASFSRSKRPTTFEIGLRRDKLPACTSTRNWIRMHVLDRSSRRGRERERGRKKTGEKPRANVRERQAENDQPYRQTVGRLILPGARLPATPSIRLRRMRARSHLRVINNI